MQILICFSRAIRQMSQNDAQSLENVLPKLIELTRTI